MINRNSFIAVFAAVVALAAAPGVKAQSNISEDFTGATTQNSWWFFNGACLTASTLAGHEPTVAAGVGVGGQVPGCTTIATTYYNKSSGEHLVGGQGLTNTTADPATKGALRFTNGSPYGYSENGGIVFATPFPTGQGVSITFKTVTYLGDSGGGGSDGADGMSFFLMDATQLNTATITGVGSGNGNGLGSWGGSLGYTCSNSNTPFNGLIGAYLGLGIDEYGNFLNGSSNTLGEGGTSATGDNTASGGGYQPGRIGIRGAGNVAWATLTGAYGSNPNNNGKPYYPGSLATSCAISGGTYSAGSGLCSGNPTDAMWAVQNTCSTGTLWNYKNVNNPTNAGATSLSNAVNTGNATATPPIPPILDYTAQPGGYVVLPAGTQIANEAATTRSAATPIFYQLKISQNGRLSLSYATCPPASMTGCSAFTSVITNQNITTSNGPLPANFLFGFAGSTGGSTNVHEILCFKAAPATSASSSAGASEKQSAKLETGTQAYFAYYNPSNGWTGRVTASGLGFDSFGNVTIAATPNWDASCVLTGVSAASTCSTTGIAGPSTAESPVYSAVPFSSRQILSWNGTTGVAFEYSSLSAAQQAAIDLGDTSGSPALSSASCAVTPPGAPSAAYWNQDRVNYLRGDRSCEVNSAGVGLFRRRSSVLADIMDSSPIWVGAPGAPYPAVWSDRLVASDPLPENAAPQSYPSWATAANQANRTQVVYVGANDGMLHGFRSGYFNPASAAGCASNPTPNCGFTNNDGMEVLAYVPGAIISGTSADLIHTNTSTPPASNVNNIPVDYANPQYGHNYFVNATPGTGDVFFGGAWHTWLVGGLGAGGGAIYALDITNPGQTTASGSVAGNFNESHAAALVLGEWTSANAVGGIVCSNVPTCRLSLGNTFGTPQIRRLHDGKWGMIFGNGFGSANGDAGIFVGVLNPNSGAVTFYYYSAGAATGPNNGIAFTTPVDLDGDHVSDYVYAGDLKGNLWRFDLTSNSEGSWAVTPGPLFTTAAGQPITTAIVAASGAPSQGMQQQLMLLFGTGQKIGITNTTGTSYASGQQSLYGVWDWNMSAWNAASAFTQYASLPAGATGTLGQANLTLQATMIGASGDVEINSNQTICWDAQSQCSSGNTKFGWYINLPSAQEQIIYSPELVSQALTVNSIVPATNTPTSCTNNPDTGYTYVLNALTGGAFNQVFLPPSEAQNPGVNTNQAYLDAHAIAMLTNATGSSFITGNASGTQYLIYETNQVESGNGGNNIQGGSLGLNLPPNTIGRRLGWIELR
ncbi:MAG TPA: PilC/PilY family type IV pilus protein [Steroidobacteraceae bacterium]|nr:PilC/PilY family type IV pilus protein [Steroidobacteraceae bacterium]